MRVVNSAENMYFHARFLGCSQSGSDRIQLRSTNGFLNPFDCAHHQVPQDDDYLILPEIIHTLCARVSEHSRPTTVHLLPPHGRLSSDLRLYTLVIMLIIFTRLSRGWNMAPSCVVLLVRIPLTAAIFEYFERSEDGGQLFYCLKKSPTGDLF